VYYEQYKAGTLDIHEYLGFALRPLANHSAAELAGWHAEFMRARIVPMITPAARALVRRHLHAGELCAIITSTNSFVTGPIAAEFGVEHLIATEREVREGRYTGRVAGTPCFREGKLVRLDEWLARLGRRLSEFEATSCYSDSHNDLPLLERVSRPVAVDPDETLAREAARRGWERISLR
jgi:HAD superfamily hydrolase (TIGR01490 family)